MALLCYYMYVTDCTYLLEGNAKISVIMDRKSSANIKYSDIMYCKVQLIHQNYYSLVKQLCMQSIIHIIMFTIIIICAHNSQKLH